MGPEGCSFRRDLRLVGPPSIEDLFIPTEPAVPAPGQMIRDDFYGRLVTAMRLSPHAVSMPNLH
jgi:hypothetical protein